MNVFYSALRNYLKYCVVPQRSITARLQSQKVLYVCIMFMASQADPKYIHIFSTFNLENIY